MMEMVITSRDGDYFGDACHIWEITDESGVIAGLYVDVTTHEIGNIEVSADHRGKGLARALYNAASSEMTVFHAPEAHRTAEGDLFARAVGGPTIAPYECGCATCTPIEDDVDEDEEF